MTTTFNKAEGIDERAADPDAIELSNGVVDVTLHPALGGQITRFQPVGEANAIAHYE